jgi:hypothetical protein
MPLFLVLMESSPLTMMLAMLFFIDAPYWFKEPLFYFQWVTLIHTHTHTHTHTRQYRDLNSGPSAC